MKIFCHALLGILLASRAFALDVHLVVGDSGSLTSGDTALSTRLSSTHGHSVTVVDDSTSPNLTGIEFVMIAATAAKANVGTNYTAATIPVIVISCAVSDNWSWFTNTCFGGFGNTVRVSDEADPLSVGLTVAGEPHAVCTDGSGVWLPQGDPPPSVDVALRDATTDANVVFRIPSGGALQTGNAAGWRGALFVTDAGVASLNATGNAILDAVIDAAEAESSAGGSVVPIILQQH